MRIRTAHDLAAVARGRRLDRGWSQADTARRAGVSRKWVSDFETGKTSVDLANVLRLLDVLEISLMSVDPPLADGSAPAAAVDLDDILNGYLER